MTRPEIPAFVLSALATVAGAVLAGVGHAVPPEIWIIAGAGLTGGAGIAVPSALAAASSTAKADVVEAKATPPAAASTATAAPVAAVPSQVAS